MRSGLAGPAGGKGEPAGAAAGVAESRWYACLTRARHEKRVATELVEHGFETFLPLIPRMRQWKDRKKRVEFPLFPSYVFARFAWRDVHPILKLPGVSTIVRFGGRPAPIADDEIENIRRFAAAAAEAGLDPEPVPYVGEGDWVRVVGGPFRGVEGVVVERRGRRRVLVGLRVIGQGLEVDVDLGSLRPVPRPRDAEAATGAR